MKLGAKTLQVLKSYSTINPSILFRKGTEVSTISPTKTIMARSKVDTEFPVEFAIYELPRFLGVLSLFDSPELEFDGKTINISGNSGDSISYTCAEPTNIVSAPESDPKFPEVDITFDLKGEDFSKVLKALSVLGLPEIAVVGDGSSVYLKAVDSKNPTGDVYKTPVGTSDKTFKCIFKPENLRLMPGDYTVDISSKGISRFHNETENYYIAIEKSSSF